VTWTEPGADGTQGRVAEVMVQP